MIEVLLVTEADWVVSAITEALEEPGVNISTVSDGRQVLARVASATPDIVVVDSQIGSMGGMAVCKDLRLEAGMNRLPKVPLLLLLDRSADAFLAKHSEADGWITKPLDALNVRSAVDRLLSAHSVHG